MVKDKNEYKGGVETLNTMYHLNQARLNMKHYVKSYPETVIGRLFDKNYIKRVDFIGNDFITNAHLNNAVPALIPMLKAKWEDSSFNQIAVFEKMSLLTKDQLEQIEPILDALASSQYVWFRTYKTKEDLEKDIAKSGLVK